MAEIRPEEVSAILREQLAQSRTEAQLEEVGTVLTVGDGVARIYGLTKAQAGELLTVALKEYGGTNAADQLSQLKVQSAKAPMIL